MIKAILEREKITRRMTAHLIPRALSHVSFRESLFNLHDPGRLSPTVRSISGSRSPSITRFRTPSVVTLTEGAKLENLFKQHRFFYLFITSLFHDHQNPDTASYSNGEEGSGGIEEEIGTFSKLCEKAENGLEGSHRRDRNTDQ